MQDNLMCVSIENKNLSVYLSLYLSVCLPTYLGLCRLNGSNKTGKHCHKDVLTEGCETAVSTAPDFLP